MYQSRVEDFLVSGLGSALKRDVQLIFTSPPFPLNRKKKYGNLVGEEYLEWIGSLARPLGDLLAEDGSLVVELGNAWEPGKPTMSTLALEALLKMMRAGGFFLCQQFVVHNPARLPSPAQWVNVERIRVKDAYTHVWWMSRGERPKADNRRVLTGYSASMRKLLERQQYNAGDRPSGHQIGETSFLKNNGGAIPSNVLTISNTVSTDSYRRYCRDLAVKIHPARMAPELAEFFIRFLTDENDLVLDPFGGSNTTGAVAERLGRQWLAIEPELDYIRGSRGRFPDVEVTGPDEDRLDTEAVLAALARSADAVSRSDLVAMIGEGYSAYELDKALRTLIRDGRVTAEGNTRARRYRGTAVGHGKVAA